MISPDFISLLRFTYHAVPEGKPVSVNVTLYAIENCTDIEIDEPLTVNEPKPEGAYIFIESGQWNI